MSDHHLTVSNSVKQNKVKQDKWSKGDCHNEAWRVSSSCPGERKPRWGGILNCIHWLDPATKIALAVSIIFEYDLECASCDTFWTKDVAAISMMQELGSGRIQSGKIRRSGRRFWYFVAPSLALLSLPPLTSLLLPRFGQLHCCKQPQMEKWY